MVDSQFVGLAAVVAGLLLCFGGLRFFRFLMGLVGLAGGFALGAMGVAVLTKTSFLGSTTGWIVGIVAGLILAGFAIAIYVAGVAVIGGAVGYGVAFGVMSALSYDAGSLITQAVAVGVAVVAIVLTFVLNVPRALVVLYTALGGAAVILAGVLIALGKLPLDSQRALDVVTFLRGQPAWLLGALVLALAGIGAQWRTAPRRPKPAPAPAAAGKTEPASAHPTEPAAHAPDQSLHYNPPTEPAPHEHVAPPEHAPPPHPPSERPPA
jgi:hypothetical protein